MPTEYDFGKYYLLLDKKLNRHIQSSDNPHKTTKAQIGLGNVENYSAEDMPLSKAAKEEILRLDTRIDKISLYADSYSYLGKMADYLYEAHYDNLNYDYALEFLNSTSDVVINWCSCFKVDKYVACNLDAFYNEYASFIIKTNNANDRYASIGVSTGVEFLTDDFVDSREPNNIYRVLPFLILQGINEKGVFAALHTNGRQEHPVLTVIPTEEITAQYNALMLVRYILDNFDSAEEAVQHIHDHIKITIPSYILSKGYECQWIVGDQTKVFIISLDEQEGPVLITEVTDNPIMTNFSYKNLHLGLQEGDLLKVYTPATQDLSKHWDATDHNQIKEFDFGLERYNILVDSRRTLLAKEHLTAKDVQNELKKVFYTKAYTLDPSTQENEFWFTDYVDSKASVWDPDNPLTVKSEPEEFSDKIVYVKELFDERTRESGNTRESVVSVVYDLEKGKAFIWSEERIDSTFIKNVVDDYQEQINRITDELIPAEEAARIEADTQLENELNDLSDIVALKKIAAPVDKNDLTEAEEQAIRSGAVIENWDAYYTIALFPTTPSDLTEYDGIFIARSGRTANREQWSQGYYTIKTVNDKRAISFKITLSQDKLNNLTFIDNLSIGTRASFSVIGQNSVTIGSENTASGTRSFAQGIATIASGNNSHAEGSSTTASGAQAHAEGNLTNAIGISSHSEGHNTSATAQYAHTEGYGTSASGSAAHAEGDSAIASGNKSHAEGEGTKAIGVASHAEGSGTTAGFGASHAEGSNSYAGAPYSHTEGEGTYTGGKASHAEGYHTKTVADFQHAFGKYNATDASFVEMVGKGTADNARSNARTLDWNGNETLAGGLTSASITSPILNNKTLPNYPVDNNPYIYKQVNGTLSWVKDDSAIPLTWLELRTLSDSDSLQPGAQYRITDYQCTTTTANTSSANHQFDIIVVADTTNTLNENARACLHETDAYWSNTKMEAWELKYCLKNDASRFTWADTINGKGVIYYMKDEFNNECGYDFKNMLFTKNGKYTNAYTFSHTENNVIKDTSLLAMCHDNVIGPYVVENWFQPSYACSLPFNVFYSDQLSYISELISYCNNKLICNCHDNTFGASCRNNLLEDVYSSSFKDRCYDNILINSFGISLNSCCQRNQFIESANNSLNTFCESNLFQYSANNQLNMYCSYNIFQRSSNNILGQACYWNVFGSGSDNNTLEARCYNINFVAMNKCNKVTNYSQWVTFDNGCSNIQLTSSDTSVSESNYRFLQNIYIHKGVSGTNSSNLLVITLPDRERQYLTEYKPANSIIELI